MQKSEFAFYVIHVAYIFFFLKIYRYTILVFNLLPGLILQFQCMSKASDCLVL